MKTYINPYILKLLDDALSDELSDYMLYTAMSKKCVENGGIFTDIASDELKHRKMLTELYTDLSGKAPELKEDVGTDISDTCEELVKEQISKELEGAATYRTLYFAMPTQADKNIIFEIMTDEMFHAILLSSIIK
jgi:rubrerythrin